MRRAPGSGLALPSAWRQRSSHCTEIPVEGHSERGRVARCREPGRRDNTLVSEWTADGLPLVSMQPRSPGLPRRLRLRARAPGSEHMAGFPSGLPKQHSTGTVVILRNFPLLFPGLNREFHLRGAESFFLPFLKSPTFLHRNRGALACGPNGRDVDTGSVWNEPW